MIIIYFYQKPLKPAIGQYSSTSAADADETPFLEMCIGKYIYLVFIINHAIFSFYSAEGKWHSAELAPICQLVEDSCQVFTATVTVQLRTLIPLYFPVVDSPFSPCPLSPTSHKQDHLLITVVDFSERLLW